MLISLVNNSAFIVEIFANKLAKVTVNLYHINEIGFFEMLKILPGRHLCRKRSTVTAC